MPIFIQKYSQSLTGMRYYLFLIFCCLLLPLAADPPDTSQIRKQFREALALNETKNFRAAADIAEGALQELREVAERPPELEVGLLHILGDCALQRSDLPLSISYYQQARSVLESHHLREAPLMVENLNKSGNYYLESKAFAKALPMLNRGLELGKRILSANDLLLASLYNNLGIYLYSAGDFEKALGFHQQALAIRTDKLPDPHPLIAQSYNNTGLCLLDQGANADALQAFRQAADIYSRYYRYDHQDLADVYVNIGNVHARLHQPALFSDFNRKALDIYRRTLGKAHPSLGICYNNLANAYSAAGRYQEAAALYQQALELMKAIYGDIHPDVGMAYYNLGVSDFQSGAFEKARQELGNCFRALNYDAGAASGFDEVNAPQTLLQLFKFMVIVEVDAYNRTEDGRFLNQAMDQYRQADRLLDFLRTRYEATGSKLKLLDAAHDLYDGAIELALALYRTTGRQEYAFEAFRFSEKSKGILLLEALQKAEARAFAGIPPETVAAIRELETKISELEKQLFLHWNKPASQNTPARDSLSRLIFDAKQQLSQNIREIERRYPRYYELRYETAVVPVEVVQQELLAPGQTLLEYFLAPHALHIFVINQHHFSVQSLEVDPQFFRWLETCQQAIRSFPHISSGDLAANLEAYAQAASYLYQHLIEPVKSHIGDQLIIIPDNELGLLSFGALLSGLPENRNDLRNYPYLAKDHAISYNYSARLLQEMVKQQNKPPRKPYLGLAPAFPAGNSLGLPRLRYNLEEVQNVRERLGGEVLLGQEASKKNFLEQQAAYQILHLATHGKANSDAGDYSFLAFSESDAAADEEALLYVKEVYNLSTNADLVLLSACETSAGELQRGEGVASMARSFSYAGARSLIATLWSVDDQATRDLVGLFFENIDQGLPKDKAIQLAIHSFLDNSGQKYAHPYYWASFLPVGNMEPLPLNVVRSKLIWSLPVLLVIGIVFLWKKIKIRP